jgi:DNA polymerase III epsilon subunit-like protein
VVCHNADFDRGCIVSHMRRAGLVHLADAVDAKEWVCTMRRASENEPAFNRKYPKLADLVRFYGLEWPSAAGEQHTAAADATACAMCHAVQTGGRHRENSPKLGHWRTGGVDCSSDEMFGHM